MRYAWVWLCWLVAVIGYRIRPYDMLADRRRWFWQERQRCHVIDIRNEAEWNE